MKKKHAKTIRDLAAELPNASTGRMGISPRRASAWRARFGWQKGPRGFDVASCILDVEQALENHPSHGANNDLKREMMKRQIAILKLKEDEQAGRLVPIDRVMDEQRRLIAGYRGAIESWKQCTIARHPQQANAVDEMVENLLRMMRESIRIEQT